MREELREVLDLHGLIRREMDKGIIGLGDVKLKTEIAFLSEIPTTLAVKRERRVNAGLVLLMGVPGVGKTYFGVVLARATNTNFIRIQGRADLTPSEVVGVEYLNIKTGEFDIKPGPIVKAEILLLDEITRIPEKAQSAFLEANQDRTVTIGEITFELPEFYFAIATANPVEIGAGTYNLSAANADRFTFKVDVGYLTPDEEERLIGFDIKSVDLQQLIEWERVVALRSVISEQVRLPKYLGKYIRRLVVSSRPMATQKPPMARKSPSALVEEFVVLGASPRASHWWGPTAKVHALIVGERDAVYPEDIQALAHNVLSHRIQLKPSARLQGVGVNEVIDDIIQSVPIP